MASGDPTAALRARLIEACDAVRDAENELEPLRRERVRVIKEARAAGMTIREIERITGLSHQRVAQLSRD